MKKTLLTTLFMMAFASVQATEICGPQTDSFAIVIDASGSMMQTFGDAKDRAELKDNAEINSEKISTAAKTLIEKIGDKIGTNKMNSSLYSIAPFAELAPLAERTGIEYKTLTREKFNSNMEVFGRPTLVSERANQHFHQTVSGKNTVIFITDGGFTEGINDPVKVLSDYRKINPNARLFIVSAAYINDNKDQVNALNGQTFMPIINLETLVSDEKFFNDFISAAIFNRCDERIELKGINFAFDKATLDQKSRDILRQALEAVKSRPITDALLIQGWTDSVGSDLYNKKLSARRAQAVKNYLIQNGVDADRITVRGEGKSFKYNNQTPEGRYANRRAEIIFSN